MATASKIVPFIFALFFAASAQALDLRTDGFAINFPADWACEPDQNIFICKETTKTQGLSAAIIINFVKSGLDDSLDQYRNVLRQPKIYRSDSGTQMVSRVISFSEKNIAGQAWIEGIHFEGEISDYYTLYLASEKSGFAYLFSLSAHKDEWEKYLPIFKQITESIRLFDKAADPEPVQITNTNQEVSPTAESIATPKPTLITNLSRPSVFLFFAVVAFGLVLLYWIRS